MQLGPFDPLALPPFDIMGRGGNSKRHGGRRAGGSSPDADEGEAEGSAEEAASVTWVVGQLATAWDEDKTVRARARTTKALTRWPAPKSKGIPSMKAIDLCCDPLYHIAKLWCPLFTQPKSPPVPLLRAEALRSKTVFFHSLCIIDTLYMII